MQQAMFECSCFKAKGSMQQSSAKCGREKQVHDSLSADFSAYICCSLLYIFMYAHTNLHMHRSIQGYIL